MATNLDSIEYIRDQIKDVGDIRYRKMFGEYMIYVNNKPLIIVCNSIAYVKILPCIEELMVDASKGYPYSGAKEHYILDIDNSEFSKTILLELEKVTPLPKKKRKKGE